METWFRLPMLVRVATIVLGWFGYALLVLSLNTRESADRIAMFVGIACVMGASVTAGVDQHVQSTFGSTERLKAYRLALRTGDLQQGTELGEWRRWLRGSELSNATAALAVGPFVVFGWMSSAYSQSAYRWVPLSAFSLLLVWGFVALCRRSARIKRLAAEVKRHRDSLNRAAGTPPDATAMAARREGAFESSLAERLIGGSVMWFICAFLVLLVADLESLVHGGPRIVTLEWAAGWAVLVVVAWAALGDERDVRRNFASFEQYAEYNRTLRTGEMPADIEPDVWRGRLRSSRRENLFRPCLACFLVAVGVSSILTYQSVYHWITASVFQLVAIWLLVNWWTARERLASLAAEVERHAVRQAWG
jgi:hypothetical protein